MSTAQQFWSCDAVVVMNKTAEILRISRHHSGRTELQRDNIRSRASPQEPKIENLLGV